MLFGCSSSHFACQVLRRLLIFFAHCTGQRMRWLSLFSLAMEVDTFPLFLDVANTFSSSSLTLSTLNADDKSIVLCESEENASEKRCRPRCKVPLERRFFIIMLELLLAPPPCPTPLIRTYLSSRCFVLPRAPQASYNSCALVI